MVAFEGAAFADFRSIPKLVIGVAQFPRVDISKGKHAVRNRPSAPRSREKARVFLRAHSATVRVPCLSLKGMSGLSLLLSFFALGLRLDVLKNPKTVIGSRPGVGHPKLPEVIPARLLLLTIFLHSARCLGARQ